MNREEPLPQSILQEKISTGTIDIGARAAQKFADLGIHTYSDLLHYLPTRFEDRRSLPHFGDLADGDTATVRGVVRSRVGNRSRRGLHIFRARISGADGTSLYAVWFNQPWLEKQIFPNQRLLITGKVKRQQSRFELAVTDFEIDDDEESLSFDRIVPVYRVNQGTSQAYVRRAVFRLLARLPVLHDYLPRSVLTAEQLTPLNNALRNIHFPETEEDLLHARIRLKFDEFLFFQLALLRSSERAQLGRSIEVPNDVLAEFTNSLPYTLTSGQAAALHEIREAMAAPSQMARLLQGDVGSGKTAIAAAALYIAVQAGFQGALMAPTEILARQHFVNLQHYLYPFGIHIELLTGSMGAADRRAARERIAAGEIHVAVGTHALIQDGVSFQRLGLAVVDEEHRFGVRQRRGLIHDYADVLVMSATPIPRSLALTEYGDLDMTVIRGLPPGRKPVSTKLLRSAARPAAYQFAVKQIRAGHQVYVVAPLIEESEALTEVLATTRLAEELTQNLPADVRIASLHGRMSAAEKDEVMQKFRAHEYDLIISTTVIEVGVDVPNATVMIIENAERFGLSQLHQLRGRVGRGAAESHCLLIAGESSRKTLQRLKIIADHADGFAVAEFDLQLRGPGELSGTRQSGLPELSIADIVNDGDILERARELAQKMLAADPELTANWATRLVAELGRRSAHTFVREVI